MDHFKLAAALIDADIESRRQYFEASAPSGEEGYYAAFVIDPDGHNIEAVYKEK